MPLQESFVQKVSEYIRNRASDGYSCESEFEADDEDQAENALEYDRANLGLFLGLRIPNLNKHRSLQVYQSLEHHAYHVDECKVVHLGTEGG